MEVWESSRYCCGILKAERTIIDEKVNTWWVIHTFEAFSPDLVDDSAHKKPFGFK